LLELRDRLDAIEIAKTPFTRATGLPRPGAHWVRPEVAVQVAFIEWTTHGKLRHPRLIGVRSALRDDAAHRSMTHARLWSMKLGIDVFLALSSIVWADGRVTDEESSALLEAAKACGIGPPEIEQLERATRGRATADHFRADKLKTEERLFVYGIACWLSQVDGNVDPSEVQALEGLGDQLGLTEADRRWAAAASWCITEASEVRVGALTLARAIEASASQATSSPQKRS
jgi:hypothetical protein